jgi:hypothetical protein
MHRPALTRLALRILTAVFWVGATICVVAIAASSFTGGVGEWSSWTIGVSSLVVTLSSGGLT